jgi:hypothetical protein
VNASIRAGAHEGNPSAGAAGAQVSWMLRAAAMTRLGSGIGDA